jgi:hypothetical protein
MMPPYEWSSEYDAYAKECYHCKKVFVGNKDQVLSYNIFRMSFSPANYGDGLAAACKECVNGHNYRRTYGAALLKQQDGKCAICCEAISISTRNAYLDHDHSSDMVRGVLCPRCNHGMHYVDNPGWLEKAIEYKEKHKAAHLQLLDMGVKNPISVEK